MRFPTLLFALFALLSVPGSAGAPTAPALAAVERMAYDPAALRIELDRGACFGSCPDYRITIFGTGEVVYEGRSSVLVPGRHGARIDPSAVAALARRFSEAGFFGLRDEYVAGNISDQSEYTLSLSLAGRSKTVTDYVGAEAGMPRVVTELEQEVDRVAGSARWLIGNAETVPALQAEGFDFGSQAGAAILVTAIALDKADLVEALLDAGVSPAAELRGLHAIEAAAAGSWPIWEDLVQAGALDGVDRQRLDNAVRVAAQAGNARIVSALLAGGVDPDGTGDPLLMEVLGAECARPECDRAATLRVLLEAGADPNRPNDYGNTPLHYAENVEAARLLLDAGADPDRRNADGETPLLGLMETQEELALFLLERGADASLRSLDGETILDKARANGWHRTLAWLAAR